MCARRRLLKSSMIVQARVPESPQFVTTFFSAMTNAIKAIKAEQLGRLTTPAFSGRQDGLGPRLLERAAAWRPGLSCFKTLFTNDQCFLPVALEHHTPAEVQTAAQARYRYSNAADQRGVMPTRVLDMQIPKHVRKISNHCC